MSNAAQVYWLLGLPIDVVDTKTAVAKIFAATIERRRLEFATPNLSFFADCAVDADFQQSVCCAQLSVADGMPVVFLGRLLGIPLPERVAGSTMMERILAAKDAPKLALYFFGGDSDAAQTACERVNELNSSVTAVGATNPGYGSLESMSNKNIIDSINAADPDFLVVALGAKKGHKWINANRSRLNARVVSHLGAVVNFVAGSISRAPVRWQKFGLEWLWRIRQEPSLLPRYLNNFLHLIQEIIFRVVPILILRSSLPFRKPSLTITSTNTDHEHCLNLKGELSARTIQILEAEIAKAFCRSDISATSISMAGLNYVDSKALGRLYEYQYRGDDNHRISVKADSKWIRRLMRMHRAEILIDDAVETNAAINLGKLL